MYVIDLWSTAYRWKRLELSLKAANSTDWQRRTVVWHWTSTRNRQEIRTWWEWSTHISDLKHANDIESPCPRKHYEYILIVLFTLSCWAIGMIDHSFHTVWQSGHGIGVTGHKELPKPLELQNFGVQVNIGRHLDWQFMPFASRRTWAEQPLVRY